jgi:hypothetical protein
MCEHGPGQARPGHTDVMPLLARGVLVQVTPQWHFAAPAVNTVTQQREGEPVKVGAAVEALKRYFALL